MAWVEDNYGKGSFLGSVKNSAGDRIILPDFDSPTDIASAVKAIGEVFGNEVQEKADLYLQWHDDLLRDTTSKSGGYAMSKEIAELFKPFNAVFDRNNRTVGVSDYAGNDNIAYTTFISQWDDTAYYAASDHYFKDKGVALSDLGDAGRPVSGYLCAGGVLDNAACVRQYYDGKMAHVWPFINGNYVAGYPDDESYWQSMAWGRADGVCFYSFAQATEIRENLTIAHDAMVTGSAGTGSNVSGLGCAKFPAVVCANQHIADKMAENARTEGQLYYAWPAVLDTEEMRDTSKQIVAPFVPAERDGIGFACFDYIDYIGANAVSVKRDDGKATSTTNPAQLKSLGLEPVIDGGIGYGIFVNPVGLNGSDWVEGGIESVLEAAWAYDMFRDGGVGKLDGYFEDKARDFYRTFYGYELTGDDLKSIEAGAAE